MRTQEEILARIKNVKPNDFFGFETRDLVAALEYEHAKPYLNPGVTKEQWDNDHTPYYTPENARKCIREYLLFAFEKAYNSRGISAERSQAHFRAWMWLAGDDEILARVNDIEYSPYGLPKLEAIRQHYAPDLKVPVD